MFIQKLYSNMHAINNPVPRFTMVFWGKRIVVTPKLIFEVLCVPRVDCPDYPSHHRFSSISRDEFALLICEEAMLWGRTLNFSTTKFAKGPRILNIVMTFVLTSQSHYSTITEPYACFLLSLMEGIFIEFPSHMIVSILDFYQNTATWISSSFLRLSHISLHTCTSLFLLLSSISWVL